MKLTVGQRVFVLTRNKIGVLQDAIITKVGNKYFEIDIRSHNRYFIETLQKDGRGYTSNECVYLDDVEYYKKQELDKAIDYIRSKFGTYGKMDLPDEAILKIRDLINESKQS